MALHLSYGMLRGCTTCVSYNRPQSSEAHNAFYSTSIQKIEPCDLPLICLCSSISSMRGARGPRFDVAPESSRNARRCTSFLVFGSHNQEVWPPFAFRAARHADLCSFQCARWHSSVQ